MWGRYLLDQIEKAKVDGREAIVWFLGGAGIALKTREAVLYVDPYFGGSPSPQWLRMIAVPIDPSQISRVDAVLATHEHTDHCHRETVLPMLEAGATFIGPSSAAAKVREWIRGKTGRIVEVKPGEVVEIKDIRIFAYDARDLYAESAVTYVLETPAGAIFHSGDSSYFSGLKAIGEKHKIRAAFLSLGRNLPGRDDYMTPCDLVRAAMDLGAEILVPIHYDIWKQTQENPRLVEIIANEWRAKVKVHIMRLGDLLRL